MRPVKLKIKGLNSFAEEQIIDFEELMQRGFFGIFGPTGSGKSTILDGMILALYGMKALSRGMNEFINKNGTSASVSFEFQIRGKNRKKYLVEREYKTSLTGTKAGKCRLLDITEEPVVLEDSVKGVDRACREVLGLSAEDFMRTVVLPQGKFSEFLRVSGRDRREILERLFCLEEYGKHLEEKISQALKVQLELKENLKGQMEAYGLASEELLKERKEEQEQALLRCTELEADYNKQRAREKETTEVLSLMEEQTYFEEMVHELLESLPKIKELEASLKAAERVKGILPIQKAYEELKIQNDMLKKQAELLEKEYAQAKEIFGKAEADYSSIAIKKEQEEPKLRQKLQNGEEAIKIWNDIPQMQSHAENLDKEFKKLEKKTSEINKLQEEAELEIRRKKQQISQTEQMLLGLTVSLEYREAIDTGMRRQDELDKIKQDYENGVKKAKRIILQLNSAQEENQKRNAQISDMEKNREKLSQELGQLKMDNEKKQIQLLRGELAEGMPCPVCGSTHHEYELDSNEHNLIEDDRKTSLMQLEQIEELEQQLKTCESRMNDLRSTAKSEEAVGQVFRQQAEEEEENLKGLKAELNTRAQELEQQKNGWGTEDFKLEKEKLFKNDKVREQAEKHLFGCRKELDTLEERLEDCRKKLVLTKEQSQEVKLALFPLKNQLSEAWKRIEEKTEPGVLPLDYLKRQQEFLDRLLENHQIKAQEKERANKVLQQISDRVRQSEGQIKGNQSAMEQAMDHLNREMKQRGFENILQVKQSTRSESEITQTEHEIEQYYLRLNEYRLKSAQAEEKRAERTVTKQEAMECQECVRLGKEQLDDQKELLGELKQQIKNMEKNLKKQKILTVKLEQADHVIFILEDLKNVTRGRRFVEFMAVKRLHYIARSASKRLAEITNGNYELETNEEGEFIIRDNKNGGSLRTPGTLSGGETFVTSLALALALSGEIQLKGTALLELFFLDEGFGALDENLLDVVMTSLEKIQSTHLNIGIISHVESVKSRVPVRLIVTPSDPGVSGSRVHVEYS